jgi:hypothetical protein
VDALRTGMLSLALIVDTDDSVLESYSGNTCNGIQDDLECMEASIVPAIPVLDLRVSILL